MNDSLIPRLKDEDRAQLRKLNVTEAEIERLNWLLPLIESIIGAAPQKRDVLDELKKLYDAAIALLRHIDRFMRAAGIDKLVEAHRGDKSVQFGVRRVGIPALTEAAMRVQGSLAANGLNVFMPTAEAVTELAFILKT